jgi:Mor family transcriptional regulator
LLYGSTPPSSAPASSHTPPKTDRNAAIYRRYLAGESPSALAQEYGISEQRIFVIIRKFKRRE